MIDVKDRVPTYPGRMALTPVSGQPNTYDMARADLPIEDGTILSRRTMQLLQGDIREAAVRAGESISAGDVVDIIDGEATKTLIVSSPQYKEFFAYGFSSIIAMCQITDSRMLAFGLNTSSAYVYVLADANTGATLSSLVVSSSVYNSDGSLVRMSQNCILGVFVSASITRAQVVSVQDDTLSVGAMTNLNINTNGQVEYRSNEVFAMGESKIVYLTAKGSSAHVGSAAVDALAKTITLGNTIAMGALTGDKKTFLVKMNNTRLCAFWSMSDNANSAVRCLGFDGTDFTALSSLYGEARLSRPTKFTYMAAIGENTIALINASTKNVQFVSVGDAAISVGNLIVAALTPSTCFSIGDYYAICNQTTSIVMLKSNNNPSIFPTPNPWGFSLRLSNEIAGKVYSLSETGSSMAMLQVFGGNVGGIKSEASEAIALSGGAEGASISVGFGGYCQCNGVAKGQEVVSAGVMAAAPAEGWLDIVPRYQKPSVEGVYVGDGTYGVSNPRTLDLGFKPSLVVIMRESPGGTGGGLLVRDCLRGESFGATQLQVGWTGNGVSWHNTSSATAQLSEAGQRYRYVAYR